MISYHDGYAKTSNIGMSDKCGKKSSLDAILHRLR